MKQTHSQSAAVPTLSVLSHRSDAALGEIVKYAATLNWGTLCVTLEDDHGRFRIWASNLGALQPADSSKSLDSRLKDAPLMRRSVISGLERLQGSAERALAILNKTTPNRSTCEGDGEAATELDELLLSIRSAINHIFGLSMLIRRQRPRGRIPELGEIALESSPDISYLTDKFPKANSSLWLARRLGNNITRQRRLIQYRQHHRESLAKRDVKGSDPTDAATIVATTFQEESNASGTKETPQDSDSSRMSIFTSATSFLSLEDGTATGRSIPDLLDMTLDGVQLDYGELFECPYCRTIQNVGNQYEWKRHVFTDLQPYVCTFKDCAISNKSFPTRAEWFQHECTIHRLQWNCNWCSQPDITFRSTDELKQHLNNTHAGMVTEAQMPMILETCERPIKSFSSESCPLCADWEPPSTKENAKDFSRHLARHLQQLSLEALPLAIDGLEIKEACGLSDKESSLSHGSSNEEAIKNRSDDMRPAIMISDHDYPAPEMLVSEEREARIKVLVDEGVDTIKLPPTEDRKEETGESALKDIKGKAPIIPEEAEFNQIGDDIEGSGTVVAESSATRAETLPNLDTVLLTDADRETIRKAPTLEEQRRKLTEIIGKNVDKVKKGIQEEVNAQLEDSNKRAEKAPVRFKDAVGRKFSFPFHLCATWQGMEELIKQAFLHVDVVGPHVMEGHYDLMGPDGEIILPSVWENVIQPDMAITMVMWPMDKMPPLTVRSASGGAHDPTPILPGARRPVPGPPPPPQRPGFGPPPAAEWYRAPNTGTVGPPPGKKPVRRSGRDIGLGMAGFIFGKPEKKKKPAPSSSADQQNE